jgi:peptidoglycan/LPS O-acetylase OafA/YrhL
MKTFGQRMVECGGFGPGFDFVRLALASGVVVWHCFPLTTGHTRLIDETALWFLLSAMVPMFFVVSGFLITASAQRLTVRPYLLNRAARIFPALIGVVLLSAFVIGPLFTSLPLADYFSDPLLRRYLLNAVGLISYELPGLFHANPFPRVVNGSLWTVPYELICYGMMAGLMMLGLVRKWWVLCGLFLGLTAIGFARWLIPAELLPDLAARLLQSQRLASGAKIVPYFLLGALLYEMRAKIPMLGWLAVASAAWFVIVGVGGEPEWRKSPLFWLVSGPPLAYLTIWAGLTRLPALNILGRGNDYSYGIYLCHFPILQLLVLQFGIREWWLLALVSAPVVLGAAMLSWHGLEKPIMRLRKRHSTVGAHIAAVEAAPAPGKH